MPQKKILIVAESINVEDSSGSKANVALIRHLQKAGFQLLVLHYTRKKIELQGVHCVAIKENKLGSNYFLSRLQRKMQHWFAINLAKYLEPEFGFSFTFFNDVNSICKSLEKHRNFKPDLVLTLSKGASFRPHYALLKTKSLHRKWMAYIHDPYPFHYYPEPYNWSEPGYKKKIDFFEALSKSCRWAAFPSLLLAEWMQDKFPDFKNKTSILPHQLNETQDFLAEVPGFFDSEKFTVLHAGNLMKQRPPFYLINAFQQFLNDVPQAKSQAQLLLIGNASYHRERLEKIGRGSKNIIIRGYLDYRQTQKLQKEVSVNVILESKAEISPFLPGKFPHCIAAERMILLLGPAKSESRRLLGEDYKYCCETDDENQIADLLKKLHKTWLESRRSLRLQRKDLKYYLSEKYLKKQLDQLLK
ncbi:UDP-glycosyltransferase [Zunongwangia sp. F363]|uniref:UDP-glycosyltransferase n=1 Tax=Autumnicola tepida TaxID=3075595 RepID=A0ABU3C9N4_9FLAO|nr:UDP-glycosyltransferase [Zunongwangia sp. F363]MDT0643042.1 UDP-glycosyltransferase [Zunongwangia sp. F363]